MPHAYQLLAGRVPEADASIAEAGDPGDFTIAKRSTSASTTTPALA
jgi:hypothetical protein